MLKPDVSTLEAMVAEAEARAIQRRPPVGGDAGGRQRDFDAISAIVTKALPLPEAELSEIERITQEHSERLRRLASDMKQEAVDRSGDALQRLETFAAAEREALDALPADGWRNPWVPSWPPVYFIRSTPGGSIPDFHIEDAKSWAKWRCSRPSLDSGIEKLSFFHLWQNPKQGWALADISVRLNPLGHFECSAEGWGLPAGWYTESHSDAELSAQLAVWPLWLPQDVSQPPQHTITLARLTATAGVFDDSSSTSINQSVLVKTVRYAVPAQAFILVEASVVLDHQGAADVDLASDDFRVGCPTCFVTLPTDVNMNL
jgi:hypothetical protein